MSQRIEESVAQTDAHTIFSNSSVRKLAVAGSGAILDGSLVNRAVFNATPKVIVDGSATSLFTVDVASSGLAGGMLFYHVQASDGTDFQAMTGMVSYSAVNKAGTITSNVVYATANDSKAVSAGTLTLAFTATASATQITLKLQPTGSLTETTPYTVTYSVFPIAGNVTIV